jgi:hypothetical protein
MTPTETILGAMRARSAELAPEDHDDTAEACFREAALWFSRDELASIIRSLLAINEHLAYVSGWASDKLDGPELDSLGKARTGVSRLLDTFDPQ